MKKLVISQEQFEKLLAGRRFGQKRKGSESGEELQTGRVLRALRLHLIDGVPVRDAAFQADRVSTAAIYSALGRLGLRKTKPRQIETPRCPTCNSLLRGFVQLRKLTGAS